MTCWLVVVLCKRGGGYYVAWCAFVANNTLCKNKDTSPPLQTPNSSKDLHMNLDKVHFWIIQEVLGYLQGISPGSQLIYDDWYVDAYFAVTQTWISRPQGSQCGVSSLIHDITYNLQLAIIVETRKDILQSHLIVV